ncbi:NAD(P)/FAD-dependent oxidoreductase [Phnomibacter sp. MR]|uniref:NAD(P)/FAD-dependent oxidoreductase n=1 Tax=Phnomibacter sp. MR TaxID=3042318 RepID=UPI003A80133C
MKQSRKHIVVIGGGAAGFFCAVNVARQQPGWQVTILEKGSKVLQKVKVSGGGRCNVTHDCHSISEMSKCYPRGEKFVKKLFRHFFVPDSIQWFADRGVALKVEKDGRMFPVTNDSQTIIECLLKEANQFGIELLLNFAVKTLAQTESGGWQITADNGRNIQADALCIATGGFPKLEQFAWLQQATGHTVVPPVPSLFTFNLPKHPITKLMGVATPAKVRITGFKEESEGPLLITHWGLSGPAVLRMSAFAARHLHDHEYKFTALINWLPYWNETSLREAIIQHRQAHGSQLVINTPWFGLPARLLEFLLQEAGISQQQRWADLPALQQNAFVKKLCSYECVASGKTTFKDEFVTAGGIDTTELSPDTMQSKKASNLYFAGEIINVDGITGGYNFQHAWSSGFVAAKTIAEQTV